MKNVVKLSTKMTTEELAKMQIFLRIIKNEV